MKFSTIIPLYNKQQTVRRALYSVLSQTYENHHQNEVIVVDDGSTDDSLLIVEAIKKEFPNRLIKTHSQINSGVSVARNKGIELAQNDYITLLDADDSYEPNFYEEIALLAERFPSASVLATSYRFVNVSKGYKREAKLVGLKSDDHQILNDFFYSAAYGDLPITSSSVCIKKKALNVIGGFPVGQNMGEDQAVWSQLAINFLIGISQKIGANYFEEIESSLMQTESASYEMPYSLRLQKQIDEDEVPLQFRQSVKQYIAGHLLDLVRRNLKSGNLNAATKLVHDERTNSQYKRRLYWRLRIFLNQFIGV